MPQPNEPIASSRAKLYAVPSGGGDPKLLGLVESFQFTDQYTPELLQGLGDFTPTDSVVNTAQGNFRWGRVHQLDETVLRDLRPELARYAEFGKFDLLAIDPKDNEIIAVLSGCRPQMFETDVSNGRAMRENYSGVCEHIQRGKEASRAA